MKSRGDYFDNAVNFLPDYPKKILMKIENELKEKICEVRIRIDSPLSLIINSEIYFLSQNGFITEILGNNLVICDKKTVNDCFNRLCNFSVYSHINDINKGFITSDGCSRVGICGRAVCENGKLTSVRDITSLNIRIAKEHKGCGNRIIREIRSGGEGNILITGPPASGKTTILRDLVLSISSGMLGSFRNISVVDERREIFCDADCFDRGINTDVFSSYPKIAGIENALRCMSPDYIVTDEATQQEEIEAICSGLNSGVKFILSLHSSSPMDLKNKKIFRILSDTAKIRYIVFLKSRSAPGEIESIISSEELQVKNK